MTTAASPSPLTLGSGVLAAGNSRASHGGTRNIGHGSKFPLLSSNLAARIPAACSPRRRLDGRWRALRVTALLEIPPGKGTPKHDAFASSFFIAIVIYTGNYALLLSISAKEADRHQRSQ